MDEENQQFDKNWDLITDCCEFNFQKSENPLYIWEALSYCLATGKNLPEWIHKYLSEISKKLLDIDSTDGKTAETIRKIIKIKGPHFTQFHSSEQKCIYRQVAKKIEQTAKITRSMELVADENTMGFEKVKKLYYAEKTIQDSMKEDYEELEKEYLKKQPPKR